MYYLCVELVGGVENRGFITLLRLEMWQEMANSETYLLTNRTYVHNKIVFIIKKNLNVL